MRQSAYSLLKRKSSARLPRGETHFFLLYLCILIKLLITVAYSIIFHEVAQTNLQSGDDSVAAFQYIPSLRPLAVAS